MPDSVIPDSVVPDSTFACYAQFRCARFPQTELMPRGAHELLNPPQSDKVAKADKDATDLKLHENESGEVAKLLANLTPLTKLSG